MRRLAAVTAIAGLVSACAYPRSSSPTLHGAAYVVDAMLMVAVIAEAGNVGSGPDAEVDVGSGPLIIAAFGAVGLLLNRTSEFEAPAPAPGAPPPEEPIDDLAARATASAHARLCESTRDTMREIHQRDRARFDELARSERAIAACLAAL
jgi:hypothetical protein